MQNLSFCFHIAILKHIFILIADVTFSFLFMQGRHVKTGQLAAIKVMDVTEVRNKHIREF